MEIQGNCRTCLKPLSIGSCRLSETLEDVEKTVTYYEAFEICSGYYINASEPQEICEECASDLFHAYRFKKKVEKTQDQLLKFLQNVEIKEEKVEIFAEPITNLGMNEPDSLEIPKTEDKPWKCDICKTPYKCLNYLRTHMHTAHPENLTENCPFCKKLHHPQLLEVHKKVCKSRPPCEEKKYTKNQKFQCEICGLWYSSRDNLSFHYNKKHPADKVKCLYCILKVHPKMLESHAIICRGKRTNKEKISTKPITILDKNEPDSNEVSESEKKSWKCDLCKSVFKFYKNLRGHMHNYHPENCTEKCPHCYKLQHPQLLEVHMKVCKSRPPSEDKKYKKNLKFQCELCGLWYSSRDNLAFHYNKKHPMDKEKCPHCKLVFHPKMLESHATLCLNKGKKKKAVESVKNEEKFESQVIESENLRLCPICGLLKTETHIAQHTGKPLDPYICDICGKLCQDRTSISRHVQRIHLKLPQKCRHCKKEFPSQHILRKHVRFDHPEDKQDISCDFCGKKFLNHYHMKLHRAIHTGERFFKCNFCEKEFIQHSALEKHMSSHSNERPFSCEICGDRFKNRDTLTQHVKQVHEERNYECPKCEKLFTTNFLTVLHLKKAHPEYKLPPRGTSFMKNKRN